MPKILLVRHGETDWNIDGRFQGQRDIPLNEHGRAQALRNGTTILEHMPEAAAFDFVASPLGRTCETMEIIRGAMNLDPKAYRVDPVLMELTFGTWEGYTASELIKMWPDQMAAREADKWGFVPPGGESYEMLSARALGWFNSVTVDTVAVAHGGISRVLRGIWLGLDPVETASLDVPQDKVLYFDGKSVTWF